MLIKLNGKDESVDRPVNLMALVSAKGLVAEHVVIEHNSRIVPKDEWQGIILKENDSVEMVSFVGGG